jgi:two-component system OmpR family response regulator
VAVVEDDPRMAALLRRGLEDGGWRVELLHSAEALLAADLTVDAIVLDLMLPGLNGIDACRRLRARGDWTPTLILTARDEVEMKVRGLEAGADDYLSKPFAFAELLARLSSMTRRRTIDRNAPLAVADVTLERARRVAIIRGEEVALSPRESDLLDTFLRHSGQVLSRRQLGEQVWSYEYDRTSNVVDVYVRYLREKVGAERIETVRGIGYRWRV